MRRHLPFYVLAAAILIVGAMAFGFPVSSLWILGFVVLCPLMMIVMMGSMHGGDGHSGHGDGSQSGGSPTEDRDRKSRLGH
jgi:type III secretory pathway component EscV